MTSLSMNPSFYTFTLERILVHITLLSMEHLSQDRTVKDLGVHISSSIKSSTHCEVIASSDYKTLGLI